MHNVGSIDTFCVYSISFPFSLAVFKRSVSSDPETVYHNDYLDSSAHDRDPHWSNYDDDDDDDEASPGARRLDNDDESANLFGFFHRKKHKKHKQHKHRKHWFWKKRHTNVVNPKENKPDVVTMPYVEDNFADFSDIEDRLHPDQQKDIAKFIHNVNSEPERFDFDVDAFVANYRTADSPSKLQLEVVTDKSFYAFDDESSGAHNGPSVKRRDRRDILTQHLKAIANKIHLYPNVKDDLFEWSLPSLVAKKSVEPLDNPSGNTGDAEDNRYIDHFYLLNDGSKTASGPMPPRTSIMSQLNMDLELDRRFRDLNAAKDEMYYSVEEQRQAREDQANRRF